MKTITIQVPDDSLAGTITVVGIYGYGLDIKTRNFDLQHAITKAQGVINFCEEAESEAGE